MAMRANGAPAAGRPGRVLAAAALLAGGAACVTTPTRPANFPLNRTVNVVFDVRSDGSRCPVQALPQGGVCPPSQPQCPIHVSYREPQVLFQATDAKTGQPTQDKLAVQFDPFQGPPGQGAGLVLLTLKMQAKPQTSKTFPYNVQSGACPPLDPEIIVDW